MVDAWVRGTRVGATPAGTGYYGGDILITVNPGETVLRSWVFWSGYTLMAPVNEFPPGGSLLRVGMAWVPFLGSGNPTPVSQPDADWMWISSFRAREVNLSRATNVAWYLEYGTDIDISVKSQRKNQTDEPYALRVAWEFALSGQATGFQLPFWNASVDAYIRNPDASPLAVARTAPQAPA